MCWPKSLISLEKTVVSALQYQPEQYETLVTPKIYLPSPVEEHQIKQPPRYSRSLKIRLKGNSKSDRLDKKMLLERESEKCEEREKHGP